jgi:hypothetical protein
MLLSRESIFLVDKLKEVVEGYPATGINKLLVETPLTCSRESLIMSKPTRGRF